MTTTNTPAAKIAAKINSQSEAEAIDVYTGLRIACAQARKDKADHATGLMQVMVMAGDALEARIGADHFEAVMEAVDAQIYAA